MGKGQIGCWPVDLFRKGAVLGCFSEHDACVHGGMPVLCWAGGWPWEGGAHPQPFMHPCTQSTPSPTHAVPMMLYLGNEAAAELKQAQRVHAADELPHPSSLDALKDPPPLKAGGCTPGGAAVLAQRFPPTGSLCTWRLQPLPCLGTMQQGVPCRLFRLGAVPHAGTRCPPPSPLRPPPPTPPPHPTHPFSPSAEDGEGQEGFDLLAGAMAYLNRYRSSWGAAAAARNAAVEECKRAKGKKGSYIPTGGRVCGGVLGWGRRGCCILRGGRLHQGLSGVSQGLAGALPEFVQPNGLGGLLSVGQELG